VIKYSAPTETPRKSAIADAERRALPGRSGDIDAFSHQIAVRLFDDVAQMNAEAELDATLGRRASVALDHAVLHLDPAAHRVDYAAELNDAAVAGALDDAAVMSGDGGIDEVATEAPQARQGAILVRRGEPAITDDIGDKDQAIFRVSGMVRP